MAENTDIPTGAVCSIDGTCSVPAADADAERIVRESRIY